MTSVTLTSHDLNVLEKIKDPDFNPAAGVLIDETLPRDPNIVDTRVYDRVVAQERRIIQNIQRLEIELSQSMAEDSSDTAIAQYKQCASDFDGLIVEYPDYSSARNNRAQIARRLYGDAMLMSQIQGMPMPLVENPDHGEKRMAAKAALQDLDTSIRLLSPASASAPMSSQASRTLSMAHTQRAAIYLKTAKLLPYRDLDMDESRHEASWDKLRFEEAASRDLALGGRYGNPIAKGLAVSTNPTAKLCGQIVREAMKKEYGPSFGE